MSLYLWTVHMEEKKEEVYRTDVPPPQPARSPLALKYFPKPRSFMSTVQQETLPFSATQASLPPRTVTPPPAQGQEWTPFPTLAQELINSTGQIQIIPLTLERDLSLEESVSHLSTDQSIDLDSVFPDTQVMAQGRTPFPTLAQEPIHSSDQIQIKPLTLERDLSLEESVSHLSTDQSVDLNSAMTHERNPFPTLAQKPISYAGQIQIKPLALERDLSLEESVSHLSMDQSIDLDSVFPDTDLRDVQEANRYGHPGTCGSSGNTFSSFEDMGHAIRSGMLDGSQFDSDSDNRCSSRPGTSDSSACNTYSSSEDMGQNIRSGMLNGSLFDSDLDSSFCTNSSFEGSSTTSMPYRNLDEDVVMEEAGRTSHESYKFCNLPLEIQNDHMSMEGGDFNSDSDVSTASSDEDITCLKGLYSDIFEEEEKEALLSPASSSESDMSSVALSMLGLSKDDTLCQSSMVSFDSSDLLEDEQFDEYSSHSRSKASGSISHDITTIQEENEDDITEEDEEVQHDVQMGGMEMDHQPPMPLNGELHQRRQDLGTTGSSTTFSSVTDDSYMGCMSFDSLSLVSERGDNPRGLYRRFAGNGVKIDMTNHQDFVSLEKPSLQQPLNDESSQFTFESSWVSVGSSACSYDSFSSKSVKYMMDVLKEETARRRNKLKERIAKIRELTDQVSHTSKYVAYRLSKGDDEDSTLS